MRVIQLVATSGTGGLERHYVDLCHALADAGVDVVALADPSFGDRLDGRVKHVSMAMQGTRLSPGRLWRLRSIIRAIQPDIIHTHATKASSMIRLIAPLLPRATRHVATIHNRKRRLRPYRGADRIIAVSARVAELVNSARTRVVHNGLPYASVEANRSYLAPWIAPHDRRPVICTAGRLVPAKGFDLLLQAMPGLDACLLVAGEGPEHEALTRQARTLDLADRVHLLGHRDDVPHLFAASDLGVVPSRKEGFCYVVVEMLQQRLPLVATDVADVAEFIGRERVVPTGRADLLHERLAGALGDLQRLRHQLEPAFRLAREELTLDHMAERTLNVYREALEQATLPAAQRGGAEA